VLNIDGRNVRVRKIDTTERAYKLVAAFLANTRKERELLETLFALFCSRYNRAITSEDLGAFRKVNGVAKATLFVLLADLERTEVLRKLPWAGHEGQFIYYLQDGFARALFRTLKAYRRMLPAKKKDKPSHPAFLKRPNDGIPNSDSRQHLEC
jgi:hypothetical protein